MIQIALLLLVTLFAPGEVAFRINDPELIPEGIAYDPATKTFFVGSTFKRKIVAIDAAGKVRDFTTEAQDGIFGVLGMRVDVKRRILWAISSNAGATMPARGLDKSCLGCSTVTSYNVDNGQLLKKYELPNKPAVHFLNDLAVAANGDVFITDTMSGDIYRIANGAASMAAFASLGAQTYPNGIDIADDGKTLYVATAAGIRRVGTTDKSIAPIAGMPGEKTPVIDGLYFYRGSLVAIQPFEANRKVVRYFLNGDVISKADVVEAEHESMKQPTTGVIVGNDFHYIANAQLQFFRAMYKDGVYDKAALADVVVLKVALR